MALILVESKKNGGTGGTRTLTLFLATDFKSIMAPDYITVPKLLNTENLFIHKSR